MQDTDERDPGRVYDETRRRMVALVTETGVDAARTVVPACPAWTVQDTLAHVIGIVDDLRAGRTDGLGSEAWTAAQVEPRRGRTVAELAAEWEALLPFLTGLAAADGWMVTRLVADLVTHEHDLRAALGRPGERDSAAVLLGLERYAPAFVDRAAEAGLPPVAVDVGVRRWDPPGTAHPVLTLHGTPFEVLRALTGRRSRLQVAGLDWSGDPAPYLALISPYGQPAHDLVE